MSLYCFPHVKTLATPLEWLKYCLPYIAVSTRIT